MSPPPLPEREDIALLEPFEGLGLKDIRVVASADDAANAAAALRASRVVGFDTESKPTFAKNEVSGGPHVIQFATRDQAWLFQLHRSEFHDTLAMLLGDAALTKAGFGLTSDLSLIRQRFGVEPQGVLDLDSEFRRRGYGLGRRQDRRGAGVRAPLRQVAQGDDLELGQPAVDRRPAALCGQRRLRRVPHIRRAGNWVSPRSTHFV